MWVLLVVILVLQLVILGLLGWEALRPLGNPGRPNYRPPAMVRFQRWRATRGQG